MNNVFVYCEIEGTTVADVSLELLTKGRKLANQLGCQLEAIAAGTDLAGIEKAVPRLRRGGVHQYDLGAENGLRCLCDVLQRAENLQCAGKR